jgi:UDP-3-O-[3-hydroxymyristoyl] glucosamine N-acyltransferase
LSSFVAIKNSLIKAYVHIKDGAKIGVKGFGFIPIKQKNLRTPQIGKVILEEGVEIGANSTVDRGSVADTTIGKNTFLDNHIHIAHNVKIGEDCMLAAQVGISGSTIIGNNVMIGGQAGIAGHLKIGNNVKIGGASGITTDLADNSKVMGYPAMPLRDFARLRNKIEK